MLKILCSLFASAVLCAQSADTLPETKPWQFPADIVAEQYRELRGYFEREIARLAAQRRPFPDGSVARQKFRELIQATDSLAPPKPETTMVSDFGPFTASLVHWPILRPGNSPSTIASAGGMVREYGILLAQKSAGPHPSVIVIPDANQSAADLCGLTTKLAADRQHARTFAARGFTVFVPFFVQRRAFSEPWTNDRSWLFRLGYQTGQHLIGSEVQQVSSAARYLQSLSNVDRNRIAVAGAGQGGLIALYSAALDEELRGALVIDYFDEREYAYEEPEDRMIWNHLREFGDAQIAGLIAPRPLWIDGGGSHVQQEFARIDRRHAKLFTPGTGIISLSSALSGGEPKANMPDRLMDADECARIANAQFSQWQARYRNLAIEAYAVRESAWQADTASIERYRIWARPKIEQYFDVVGRFPDATGSFDARSIKIYDEPDFSGYRLSVRLYDGVHAYGVLLVPKNLRPGEKRAVVFTQHGLAGKPEDALGVVPNSAADAVYSRFGMNLAKRGYVVFAPMISTQTGAERDAVGRRAALVGQTAVGIELKKFGRVIDFLSTLPFVDPARFAFYGLSYGGYTALWIGPGEPRFRVVVSSGHFNDWDIKTSDPTQGTSFLFYPNNLDMFNFNLLNRFSHSEFGMLVAPRAFMIEVGDRDGVIVAPRRFADVEMERVIDLYRRLGIPEKGRIARFDGPHKVDGKEAFDFLDRWLQ